MYIFLKILKQSAKLFGASILASVIFAGLANNIPSEKTLLFILLLFASLLIFLYTYNSICLSLHITSENFAEYITASLAPLILYIFAASILYCFKLSNIYLWLFLPTRFLEPFLPSYALAVISQIASYLLMLVIIMRFPIGAQIRSNSEMSTQLLEEEEEEYLREQSEYNE